MIEVLTFIVWLLLFFIEEWSTLIIDSFITQKQFDLLCLGYAGLIFTIATLLFNYPKSLKLSTQVKK